MEEWSLCHRVATAVILLAIGNVSRCTLCPVRQTQQCCSRVFFCACVELQQKARFPSFRFDGGQKRFQTRAAKSDPWISVAFEQTVFDKQDIVNSPNNIRPFSESATLRFQLLQGGETLSFYSSIKTLVFLVFGCATRAKWTGCHR